MHRVIVSELKDHFYRVGDSLKLETRRTLKKGIDKAAKGRIIIQINNHITFSHESDDYSNPYM